MINGYNMQHAPPLQFNCCKTFCSWNEILLLILTILAVRQENVNKFKALQKGAVCVCVEPT